MTTEQKPSSQKLSLEKINQNTVKNINQIEKSENKSEYGIDEKRRDTMAESVMYKQPILLMLFLLLLPYFNIKIEVELRVAYKPSYSIGRKQGDLVMKLCTIR